MLPVMASMNSSGPDLFDGLEKDLLLLDIMLLFFSFNSPLGTDLSPENKGKVKEVPQGKGRVWLQ